MQGDLSVTITSFWGWQVSTMSIIIIRNADQEMIGKEVSASRVDCEGLQRLALPLRAGRIGRRRQSE
jgi:hypothetical protein